MSTTAKDITGQKFSRLTAIQPDHRGPHGYMFWKFKCDCGKIIVCSASIVWRGRKKSCGCFWKERALTANLKHGCKNTRIYRIWAGIKTRCLNPNSDAFHRYGGRGITVCKRWLKFENFLEDMGRAPNTVFTIDRIDNSKGYSKENCRWASKKEQNRNARTNINYTLNGKTMCLSAWAEEYKMDYLVVWGRVKKCGWELLRALTEPVHTEKARNRKEFVRVV